MNMLHILLIIFYAIFVGVCLRQIKIERAKLRMLNHAKAILVKIKEMQNDNQFTAILIAIQDFNRLHLGHVPDELLIFHHDSLYEFARCQHNLLQFSLNKYITANPQNDY